MLFSIFVSLFYYIYVYLSTFADLLHILDFWKIFYKKFTKFNENLIVIT